MANTLGFGQLRQLWLQAGGNPAWADRMANIALRESSGNPTVQNLKYPDHSIGLWQINQLAHKGRYGNDQQLMNPLANARAAVAVFKAQGPTAWSTYNPAIDKKYLGPSTGGPLAGGKTVQTTTVKSPGVDNSSLRRDLIAQFVMQGGPSNDNALIGLASGLQGAQDTPSKTVKVRKQAGTTAPTPASSGYVNPFGSSLKGPGRIDEGVDPNIQGPIRAIGDAKVVNISHNFYKGQPYIVYQLTSGPHAGKYVYVSELVTPHVQRGQTVKAGDVIATGHGPIETGWAGGPQGGYMPLANRAQGGNYTEGAVTGPGQSFAALLKRLGANAATGL